MDGAKEDSNGALPSSGETEGSITEDESEILTQPILLQPRVEVVPLPASFDKQFKQAPVLKGKRGRPQKTDSQKKSRSS